MRFRISLALAMLSVTALASSGPSTAQAEMLRFTFNDIAGDPRDNFDVTQVEVTFDNVTGAYTIAAESTQEHPFSGSHYLYLGAFNPDTPSENQYFGVGRFGYYTETVSTRQERSGVSPNLVGWMAGERVASYDLFGSPSGNAFQSVIGGNRGDYNETDEIRDDAVIQSVVVPEPQALLGVLWGGLLLLGSRRSQ